MAKFPVSFQVSHETSILIESVKSSLMKSKNWIVENSILNFSNNVKDLVALDEDLKEYLEIKKNMWKDNLYSEMLRYNLSKGFMLKNSIRKIYEMVAGGVNKHHIEKVITSYSKLCNDGEYMDILEEVKQHLKDKNRVSLESIKLRVDKIEHRRVLKDDY